jgi:hypothetical protein
VHLKTLYSHNFLKGPLRETEHCRCVANRWNDSPHIEIPPNCFTKCAAMPAVHQNRASDISIQRDGHLPIETLDRAAEHDYDVSKEHQEWRAGTRGTGEGECKPGFQPPGPVRWHWVAFRLVSVGQWNNHFTI